MNAALVHMLYGEFVKYIIYKQENELPDLADNVFDTEWFKNFPPKIF